MRGFKRGIALLITLLFIIAITVAVGIGLKYVNEASHEISNENFMLQTAVILDDVLNLLKTNKELDQIVQDQSADSLYLFLSEAGFIPLESSGVKVMIEITSARSKFNINALKDNNASTLNIQRVNAMKEYMARYMVNEDYVTILLDLMGGVKEDLSYNSGIFNEKSNLFRDYIVSKEHLENVNTFYKKEFRDNNVDKLEIENLFYFSGDKNSSLDVNQATAEAWELLLGCDTIRGEELAANAGTYTTGEDLYLSSDETIAFGRFQTSYFEPYLDVKVEVLENNNSANIRFEYDMKNKKGSNFVYEI